MLEKGGCHEIVRTRFASRIHIETEKRNRNKVIRIIAQNGRACLRLATAQQSSDCAKTQHEM